MLGRKLATIAMTALATVGTLAVSPGTADAATSININSGGDITINGDNADQQVQIWIDEEGNGRQAYVEVTTNGNKIYDFAPNLRDVTINTRGGNDTVSISGYVPLYFRKATINLGSGDNDAFIGTSTFSDNLRIVDGAGDADIRLRRVDVGGTTTVTTGSGHAAVTLIDSTMAKTATIVTASSGQLEAEIEDTVAHGKFEIRAGNKADTVKLLGSTDFHGSVAKFNLKNGNDTLLVRPGVEFHTPVDIQAGGGHDHVNLFNNTAHGLFTFDGGSGNDIFNTTAVYYSSAVTLKGGSGSADQFGGEVNTFTQSPTISGFELG